MLDVDRFRQGGGPARSVRREKSSHRPHGSSKVVMPDLRPRGGGGGGGGDLVLPSDAARGRGNFPMRKQASALKVEADEKVKIPAQHNMESSSKRASGTPVKILMEKEMQNHVESKRHSTSVIAKLMGLDPLPNRQPCNMQKRESVTCSHKGSSEGFPGRISCEQRKQEFKDIFEVLETKALERPKSLSSRRRSKEMAMIRQKDKLQKSEESSETSEISDSSKDLNVGFLQEPASLFEKYLRDLHYVSATPEACHITVLKSSNVPKHKNSEMYQKSERTERNTPMRRNATHKPEADIFLPINKEHTVSCSSRLSKSKLGGNIDVNSLPTRIVVLKPSLEKDQKSAKIQGTSENFQLSNIDYRRRREFRRSGSVGLFSDLKERQTLPDDAELSHRMKSSREIAKEITKHMRHTVNGDDAGPRHSTFPGHGNLHKIPVASVWTDSEAVIQTSGPVDGWYKNYNSSYSNETYASREAKKHLSERWMMTHKSKEVGHAGDGLSTLGEMLALSDRETPNMLSSSVSGQEKLPVRFHGKEVYTRWISPSGISSKDGWKDGCASGLPRSKSLPASSTIYGSPNSADVPGISYIDNPFMLKDTLNVGSRKFSVEKSTNRSFTIPYKNVKNYSNSSQPSSCDEEENKLPVRGSLVDQNELVSDVYSKNSTVEKFPLSESSACSISDTTYVVDCVPVSCDVGPEFPCLTAEQQLPQSIGSSEPEADECSPANCEKEIVAKESLHNQPESASTLPHTHITGETCLVVDKVVEQPSPISVLEPPEENECSPESFERVSADLQELRMQLELLKLETRDTNSDRLVIGNEDASGEVVDVPIAGISQTSGDEEDRDFSYILNVLRDSGFHNADHDTLFSAFYSTEYPVCPDAFEKLEKIYGGVTWSRAERKLLFDLANTALADILALNNDLYPWVNPKGGRLIGCRKNLGEEWQSLVRQRMAVSSDASDKFIDAIRWLDLTVDIDSIGREVERMLKDDLLEELVSDILCV
ncbi:hypothetical protein Taro_041978 [Colocasia esculenta]|uniref:DUF4378 domain-containing protein n=1 Tax=Colocasia esculenta TaxID=4460 RepID=A0A843WN91_COLES|nr:hypothetical protein [Colocasia esculenta]